MPSYLKTRLARGTVNMGDRRFPDHYCFSVKTNADPSLNQTERWGWVHYCPRAWRVHYSDILWFPPFIILSFLFLSSFSVRNILGKILNVTRNPSAKGEVKSRQDERDLQRYMMVFVVFAVILSLMVFWSSLLSLPTNVIIYYRKSMCFLGGLFWFITENMGFNAWKESVLDAR